MKTISTNHSVDRRPRQTPARWILAATAIAALTVAGAVFAFTDDEAIDSGIAAAPLELSLGPGDALASCLPLEAGVMSSMSPAFAGTATAVEAETVTLAVDRWYVGGDASTVELHAAHGMEALIAGFDFEVGQQYLITAADGSVNYCGYSGPATAELAAVFDQAFPAG